MHCSKEQCSHYWGLMARAQFEYDEVGNSFYYFVVSFYALLLVPATLYLWPSKKPGLKTKSFMPLIRFSLCQASQLHDQGLPVLWLICNNQCRSGELFDFLPP